MNKGTVLAFIFATLAASIVYGLYFHISYYHRVGVTPGSLLGAVFLMFVVASISVLLFAVPIHVLLAHFSYDKPAFYLVLGTLLGGIVIGMANTGVLWRHPEGFITGLVAALTFNYVRANSSFNKARKMDT